MAKETEKRIFIPTLNPAFAKAMAGAERWPAKPEGTDSQQWWHLVDAFKNQEITFEFSLQRAQKAFEIFGWKVTIT